jgi:hypothetical protein
MDKNELFAEYYIVKFCDNSGKEYITSLSVLAKKKVASSLKNTPLKISACTGATPVSNDELPDQLVNSNDKQLLELREKSLNGYSQNNNVPRAGFTLGYITDSVEQYQSDFAEGVVELRIMLAVLGVALILADVWLIRFIGRKTKSTSEKK